MDPFARKMVYGSFVYGGIMLLMFAVLSVVYLHMRPRCMDRVVAESTDPTHQWTAALMERRCGEDAPFFTHLNLRVAGAELQRGFFSGTAMEGEIFLMEQDAASSGITINWNTSGRLNVQCPRCSAALVQKREERWGDIAITYGLSAH